MFGKINKRCTQSQVHYSFYNSISEIPAINWEELNIDNSIYFSLNYLQAIEKTLKKDIRFKYIVFFNENQKPIGFATNQIITLNTKELENQNFPCNITDGLKNTLLKNIDINILVCGNIFSCGEHGFIFNENEISTIEAYKSLACALTHTKKIENSDNHSFILVKEFWPESFKNSDYIKEEDFRELHIDVNMVVQLLPNWNTFEDYLSSMRTKYRSRAKNAIHNSEEITLKKFTEKEIYSYEEKINELYLSVIDNAYFKLGKLNANVLKELKAALKDQFIFNAYFLNNELIGFTTCFVQEKTVESFHIGFDYNFKKSHNIYQRMLYDYMRIAIENKVKELHLGRTAEIIKSCLGAKPVNMKLYIRHRNSITNNLLKPIADFITPNTHEIRNPFKKTIKTN